MKKLLIVLPLLVGLVAAVATCGQDDVGIECKMSIDPSDVTTATFNTMALDCRSRICMLNIGEAKPHCTQVCDSDSDCPDSSLSCPQAGYSCAIGSSVGELPCCKVCICNDRISGDQTSVQAACAATEAFCPTL
jgi:hypothetical protein